MSPPQTLWKKVTGPSAGLVQQHYVEGRVEALYRRNKDLERMVAQALAGNPRFAGMKLTGDKWLKVYEKINLRLQAASLTINFNADSWFSTENHFPTYAQAYARSGRNGAQAQLLGDAKNPPVIRAQADDRITFNNATGAASAKAPARGLAPGRQGMDRIREQMEFRANPNVRTVAAPAATGKDSKYADSGNRRFNPEAKQVFAALNYGRRLHGSTTDYGGSHLVLNPKFKVNALYYPGDTFYIQDASSQAAFHVLGSLVAWAKPVMLDAIIQSCYFDMVLPDTADEKLLLEGHVFSELPFTGGISEMVLDAKFGSIQHQNAKKFASKHGIKLVMVEPATR
jgi:hypothetical protein